MDGLFLKIISGEIPSSKIYEDEHTFAFLDINPVNHGHTLVVPKDRYPNVYDVPEDVWVHVMKTVRKIAPAVKKAVGADGINIIMNNDPAADQLVTDHAHIHIVPRFKDDGFTSWPGTPYQNDEEKEHVAEKIRATLT